MDVIPVIDLLGGAVVHARGGRRDEYRPIETPLSASAEPAAVLAGLLRLHPFRRLYVADLDAIAGRQAHAGVLATLARQGPEIWLDNGARDATALAAWPGTLLLGSESQTGAALLAALRDEPRIALSLDFRGETFLGPPEILFDSTLWPRRVVVMTLARVGAAAGPDLARVAEVLARAEGRAVYAAGGVRDAADLQALAELGAAGALVATALHSGAIGAAELNAIARPRGRAMRPSER
jgi:HisA/HisF family protein